jgi:D-serine deaminase-like pyridoxal phosphate-dependent protein
MIRAEDGDLADALTSLSLPDGALVFVANAAVSDGWTAVLDELTAAYELSQAAVRAGGPIVYLLESDDLLGRRGIGSAMVACGLMSAARTLALETARAGVPVNVLALGATTKRDSVRFWVESLCRPNGPNGELIRLGADHLGKALP